MLSEVRRTGRLARLRLERTKWRYVDNLQPLLAYRRTRKRPSGEAASVLADLNRDGIAMTSIDSLLGTDATIFGDVQAAVADLERIQENAIEAHRDSADDPTGWKSYVFWLLGERPTLDPQSPFVQLSLKQPVLQVVNGYFGLCAQLHSYNVWHTLMSEAAPRDSQLWHRDPEDHYIVKMFVYLSDVDEDAGPFVYAIGSHPKGPRRKCHADTFLDKGVERSSDDQLAAVIDERHWKPAVGPAGTVIFADTRGYHKGGLARSRDRIIYNSTFASQASQMDELFDRPEQLARPSDRDAAFALNLHSRREQRVR